MRILLIRTDLLGDGILTNTFIKMLKVSINCEIDILCNSYNYKAFQYNPNITNKYFLYDNKNNSSLSTDQLNHNKNIINNLKQNTYAFTFVLYRHLSAYSLLKYVNTAKIFGHRMGPKSLRSRFFCWITSFGKYNYLKYDETKHWVINLFDLLKFSFKILNLPIINTIDQNSYFYTTNYNPENNNLIRDPNTIVINISGKKNFGKYIPLNLATDLIRDFLKIEKKIIIVATKEDTEIANNLNSNFSSNLTVLIETDIFKLSAQLIKYMYFIGPDGGLIHVASGLGMHCISIFHDQSIPAWHPWTPNQICVQAESHKIDDISSKQVINSFMQLINRE